MKSLLEKAANQLGLQADEVRDFTSPTFRSRPAEPDVQPIQDLFGLRIGQYPVIVAPIALDTVDSVKSALKKLHAQMVVARSFMYEREVINAHLFLCATSPTPTGDWRRLVDLIERDEAVCRKVVWIPSQTAMQQSFTNFLARTFLAMPWAYVETISDAPLDQTHELAQRILEKHGLEREVAQRWVNLTEQLMDDAESLVTELVHAKEASK
ncbi:ABC-three component system middle component 1 [Bradyrhizobium sp. BR 1433]|uniref:ABC-three component system middle component 1 n=1 Tax=Bradyrhizobium sp. BR 1433 TaxID=3447967 RepID=UPI003EE46F10